MLISILSLVCLCFHIPLYFARSTQGIEDLVRRRLPSHVKDFSFSLVNSSASLVNVSSPQNDHFVVSNGVNRTIHVEGNTPIALASGLRWYLANVAHVDIYWFIGSRLHLAPSPLPSLNQTYTGSSIVPWRYHFNTVTFSYTAAFWTWEDWEVQLDWMALRGINLPLAWVGQEKILMDVFLEAGFTEAEVFSFLSGPAFQAWNRFGNIQGSWGGGDLPISWIESQLDLQKKIVARMVELGMTPVLPCFTGFVPRAIGRVYPDAAFVNGSQWNSFPSNLTNVTFLEPSDARFAELQTSFISKQKEAYGNVTSIYTLDQYNENDPYSGDLDYLRNVTRGTWQSLKNADPEAIWLMQGWLFYSSSDFWTDERVEAYLSGVEVDEDMLILDLFSESQPQWQRTNSYYGKPWIWCQLHGYGGNMGLYGQVENVTINPIQALSNSSSLVGFGLTMEGQEGNEIMYDILLDQAWSKEPLDSDLYFSDWATTRYSGSGKIPQPAYEAWDVLRTTVYNNTNLTASTAVTKSIFELSPNTTGLLNRTGHHATTLTYQPSDLKQAWALLHNATAINPSLFDNAAFVFDLVDVTRQVLANEFTPLYTDFVAATNISSNITSLATATQTGAAMIALLQDLDLILSSSKIPSFTLSTWLASARAWANVYSSPSNTSSHSNNASAAATNPLSSSNTSSSPSSTTTTRKTTTANKTASQKTRTMANLYEYNARNQITLWGPEGEISDYSSRQWAGLIGGYYVPRWEMFIDSLLYPSSSSSSPSSSSSSSSSYSSSYSSSSSDANDDNNVTGDQTGEIGNETAAGKVAGGDGVDEALKAALLDFGEAWDMRTLSQGDVYADDGDSRAGEEGEGSDEDGGGGEFARVLAEVVGRWEGVFWV